MTFRSAINKLRKFSANLTVREIKMIELLEDFAREDFTNPFEELVRMKLQAQKLLKELKKEQ